MQKTLVVFKPDTVTRGLVGEIVARFERAGLKIVAMKMVAPDEAHFHEHYEGIGTLISRHGEDIYRLTLAAMSESPVIALVLEGIDAVEHVRKMVGATDPKKSAPGTIRGDYTHISRVHAIANGLTLPNLLHASADAGEAEKEIALWFKPDEIYDEYKTAHETTVHGRVPEGK